MFLEVSDDVKMEKCLSHSFRVTLSQLGVGGLVINVMSVTLHTTVGDIKVELFCQECPKTCEHEGRGILSMANNGPNTNKSQFFITYAKQPHLDLKYTVFGKVIDGFDALDELETIKVDAKYRPVVEQSVRPLSVSQESIEVEKERIRKSQEYFDQYIEEYYEEDDEQDEIPPEKPKKLEEEFNVESLDDVVSLLRRERARDIVAIALGADGPGVVDTIVICSPFNARHGAAVADMLRKAGKETNEQPRKCTVRRNFGWFQIELGKMQVHVMGEEARQRFDLETLWGLNDVVKEDEDIPLIPPPREECS
ncbi:putative iojap-like protein [Ancylostoma ceylanicum]|uniref:Putative iojap-like protein n=1 Tax=Ancylostoma ceylanicum TaxID=53326 RepID=A0A0D6M6R9_9BILA|nr:putative iojap-like protein [Ancylostoma ceylanicum]